MKTRLVFNTENTEKHVCKSRKEGDWLIFECPKCGYLRHWNPKTNEMNLINSGNARVLHNGSYEPIGLQSNKYKN